MNDNFTIEAALSADKAALLELLTETDLPHDGAVEHLEKFLIVRDTQVRLIACAGLEYYGKTGLLRSVAVTPGLQKSGLGSRLVAAVINKAKKDGINEILLLTTTARDFFAHRFGFVEVSRAEYDTQFSASAEWNLPRCSSAAVMKLNL